MKIRATRMGWPTREMALLMADATPALWTGTLDMSVDVSGATTSEMPTPNSSIDGRTSISVDGGGIRLAGFSIRDRHDGHECAQPVEPAGRGLVARLGHVAERRPEGRDDQRNVDEERDAPADV